jgi:hypothetical protein
MTHNINNVQYVMRYYLNVPVLVTITIGFSKKSIQHIQKKKEQISRMNIYLIHDKDFHLGHKSSFRYM